MKTINCFKALLFFSIFATYCSFTPLDLSASTAKRTEQFQVGKEILSHIIKMGGSDFLNPEHLKGKTIIMVFAAAEQEFSQKALQDVQSIIDKLKIKNVKALGIVSSSQGNPQVQKLIEQYNLNYEVLYDKADIAAQLKIIVYPTTLIIDKKGRLVYYYSLYTAGYKETISSQLTKFSKDQAKGYIIAEAKKRELKKEIRKAQKQIKNGDVESAMTTLTKLLQGGHDAYNIHLLVGYSYLGLQNPKKALSHFKKAKDKQPGSAQVDLAMGIAYSRAGEMKRAVPILTEIGNNDNGSILAFRELSSIFEKKHQLDKALYYIKKELDGLSRQIKD